VTSAGLSGDGFGRVIVDLDVPRDNEFTIPSDPDIVPSAVTSQVPAEIAKPLLEIAALHLDILHLYV
jgi:hypothetical protein